MGRISTPPVWCVVFVLRDFFDLKHFNTVEFLPKDMKDQSGDQSGDDNDSEDDSEDEKLEIDNNGFAVLSIRGSHSLEECKKVIRKYVTVNYCKFYLKGI